MSVHIYTSGRFSVDWARIQTFCCVNIMMSGMSSAVTV